MLSALCPVTGLALLIALAQEGVAPAPPAPTDVPVLLGAISRNQLAEGPYADWFNSQYTAYDLDEGVLDSLRTWTSGVAVEIFLGTWCTDSHREVPRMVKILDYLELPGEATRLFALDQDKKSPGHEEEGMNIHHVPTFIFYLDEVEIGRIIESPVGTLEKDLQSILSGEPYVPNYEELE